MNKFLLWCAVAGGTHVLFAVNPALRFSRDEVEHWMRRRLCKHADGYAVEDDAGFLYVGSLSLYLWITGYEHNNVCNRCFGPISPYPQERAWLCPECRALLPGLAKQYVDGRRFGRRRLGTA